MIRQHPGGTQALELTAGERTALANGQPFLLPAAPIGKGRDMLVPVRAATYFGYTLWLDKAQKLVWVKPPTR